MLTVIVFRPLGRLPVLQEGAGCRALSRISGALTSFFCLDTVKDAASQTAAGGWGARVWPPQTLNPPAGPGRQTVKNLVVFCSPLASLGQEALGQVRDRAASRAQSCGGRPPGPAPPPPRPGACCRRLGPRVWDHSAGPLCLTQTTTASSACPNGGWLPYTLDLSPGPACALAERAGQSPRPLCS